MKPERSGAAQCKICYEALEGEEFEYCDSCLHDMESRDSQDDWAAA